jgi:hypothetical protein
MSEPRGPSPAGVLATIGIGAAAVLCCAGPPLLADGALSGLGSVVRSLWLTGGGAALVVLAVAHRLPAQATPRRQSQRGLLPAACSPLGRVRHVGSSAPGPE